MLYVDAEQTFMQAAIESCGQQLTHKYNRGDQHIIMNGYQCYLKRMRQVIQYEVATSKVLGYNLGVKLIRGAYMNEERALAQENGYESPVWATIEETHACYNDNMLHVIEHLEENGLLFVASHNQSSVDQATELIRQRGFRDHRVRFGQLKAFSD
jgi:proline dehydrogenase